MAKTFLKGLQVFSEPLSLILQEGVSVTAALDTLLYARYPHGLLKGEAKLPCQQPQPYCCRRRLFQVSDSWVAASGFMPVAIPLIQPKLIYIFILYHVLEIDMIQFA